MRPHRGQTGSKMAFSRYLGEKMQRKPPETMNDTQKNG
jgi:hypothetical protein